MNSKALKDWDDEKKVWWDFAKPVVYFLDKWWGDLIGRRLSYLRKVWAWSQLLRNDFDFDALCLFRIVNFKLKRVKRALENGCAVQEKQDMKALDLAIKLSARLDDDHDYYWRPHRRHDRKWGDMVTWFEPVENSTSSYWRMRRPLAITEEQKEQERKEFLEAAYAEEFLRNRDKKILFAILDKYIRTWWD